jgi:hypothetical protein
VRGNFGEKARISCQAYEVDSKQAVYLPVPLNDTRRGPPGSEVTMLRVPSRGPEIAGLHVTEMVQLAPAAKLWPQLLVSAKSIPEVRISPICNSPLPPLVMVMIWGGLTVSTGSGGKVMAGGVILRADGDDCAEASTVSRGKLAPTGSAPTTRSATVSHLFNRRSLIIENPL